LEAENEKSFYLRGTFLNVRFKKDKDGRVVGAEAEQFSGVGFAKKVSDGK